MPRHYGPSDLRGDIIWRMLARLSRIGGLRDSKKYVSVHDNWHIVPVVYTISRL